MGNTMSKKLWQVKQGNRVVEDNIEKKTVAKERRDSLQGGRPEFPDDAASWQYHVSRGPDHRRS
jgi:hypothetical protein